MTAAAPAAAFVVLAGGSGSRLGAGMNKAFLPLAGRPMIAWSLDWAAEVAEIGPVVLVTRPGDETHAEAAARSCSGRGTADVEVVAGGTTRHASELAALDHLAGRIIAGAVDVVVIHDAARPAAGSALLRDVIRTAREVGGAVPCVPVRGVWRRAGEGRLVPPDAPLFRVQTPQAFRARPLLEAYRRSRELGIQATDTSGVVERCGTLAVRAVPGHEDNLKVTFAADLARAEVVLSDPARSVRGGPAPGRR